MGVIKFQVYSWVLTINKCWRVLLCLWWQWRRICCEFGLLLFIGWCVVSNLLVDLFDVQLISTAVYANEHMSQYIAQGGLLWSADPLVTGWGHPSDWLFWSPEFIGLWSKNRVWLITASDHVCKREIVISKVKPKSVWITFRANKPPGTQLAHYKLGRHKSSIRPRSGHLLHTCLQQSVNKMLSYRRETVLQGTLLLTESGRLELGNNILLTLYVCLQPLWHNRQQRQSIGLPVNSSHGQLVRLRVKCGSADMRTCGLNNG